MAQPARLTSDLLARKGQALPTGGFARAKLDLIPVQPAAARPERQLQGASASREAPSSRPHRPTPERHIRKRARQPASPERIAFTLRLDPARHARLKILAAQRGRSGQEMLLKALDAYLEACAADRPCLRSPKAAKPGTEPARS